MRRPDRGQARVPAAVLQRQRQVTHFQSISRCHRATISNQFAPTDSPLKRQFINAHGHQLSIILVSGLDTSSRVTLQFVAQYNTYDIVSIMMRGTHF